uniref:Pachytene checkpoint protein 2 homolog n=2 Tax=Cyprinus carpio TaxID=7962 RepID=A0A8C1KTJ6_CYPCA
MDISDHHMTDAGIVRPDVHIEVHVKSQSTVKRSEVRTHVLSLLDRHSTVLGSYRWTEFDDEFLTKNVESVAVADLTGPKLVDLKAHNLCIHIFSLNDDSPSMLALEEEEELSAANHWLLPAAEFHGIWESLIYEEGIKTQLLDYVSTTIFFSDRNVDSNLIAWNRVVLLHGPPGTGKTSLCKGLAQKLSIRLSDRYAHSQFVEINSHSLFSKWFSEVHLHPSALKLVCMLYTNIVESLTAARSAAQAGTEPSDAIRVVNAVLTQLDQIKRHPNVVILTTSNVTEKIDLAFVDRADIKQYIGPPSASAIFHIYLSCLEELMKRHIIYPRQQLLSLEELGTMDFMESDVTRLSLTLRNLAQRSEGLSGRALRKIPFLAHALYGKSSTMTVEVFLKAMERAVDKQRQEQASLVNCV